MNRGDTNAAVLLVDHLGRYGLGNWIAGCDTRRHRRLDMAEQRRCRCVGSITRTGSGGFNPNAAWHRPDRCSNRSRAERDGSHFVGACGTSDGRKGDWLRGRLVFTTASTTTMVIRVA